MRQNLEPYMILITCYLFNGLINQLTLTQLDSCIYLLQNIMGKGIVQYIESDKHIIEWIVLKR